MCKLGVISQERLKIEIKLLLSANMKSYMPRRLEQQWITLSDLEWQFHASRAISVVVELLVLSTVACDPAECLAAHFWMLV